MQTCPGFFLKSLLEYPGNLLEICSVKFVDTLLFSWYGMLIMVGCVGGNFGQTLPQLLPSRIVAWPRCEPGPLRPKVRALTTTPLIPTNIDTTRLHKYTVWVYILTSWMRHLCVTMQWDNNNISLDSHLAKQVFMVPQVLAVMGNLWLVCCPFSHMPPGKTLHYLEGLSRTLPG